MSHESTMADLDRQFANAIASAGRTYGSPQQEGRINSLQRPQGLLRGSGQPKAGDIFHPGKARSRSVVTA